MAETHALKTLHTELIDAEKGYETAIADAEETAIRQIFEKLLALHIQAHADVHGLLAARGEHPNESGSFLALVHKTVISVRASITGLDRSSLSGFVDGEQRILKAYDEAITEVGDDPAAAAKLREHRTALAGAVVQMSEMAAAA